MNNTEKFTGKGQIYAKARPKYAPELFSYLKEKLALTSATTIADIGSGTGIFTEQLLDQGYHVYAVEPNQDMRRQAEKNLGKRANFVSIAGDAENTTLPANSVDYVTAAQAFHWFDQARFRQKCQRILKADGKVIIVYNSRIADAICNQKLAALLKQYCPNFHGFSNGIAAVDCRQFFTGNCDTFQTENDQEYTRQGFVNRTLSSSYSLKAGDKNYEQFVAAVGKLFDQLAQDGKLLVPMKTEAYIGKIS